MPCANLRESGGLRFRGAPKWSGRAQKSPLLLPALASNAPELPEEVPPVLEPVVPELEDELLEDALPELDDDELLDDDVLLESSSSSPVRYLMVSLPMIALQPRTAAVMTMPATGPAQRGNMTATTLTVAVRAGKRGP